jgi:hypothetical protein
MDGGIHNSSIFGSKIVTPCFPNLEKGPSLNITIGDALFYFFYWCQNEVSVWSWSGIKSSHNELIPSFILTSFNLQRISSSERLGRRAGGGAPVLGRVLKPRSFIHPPHNIIHPPAAWLLACVENTSTMCFLWHGERDPLEGELGPYSDDMEEMSKGEEEDGGALVTWYGLQSNYSWVEIIKK